MNRRNLLFELRGGRAPHVDGATLARALTAVAETTGLRVLETQYHDFEPQGATAALLLSESHLTAHTWPEEEYVAVDLFTCSAATRVDRVQEALRRALEPQTIAVREVPRG